MYDSLLRLCADWNKISVVGIVLCRKIVGHLHQKELGGNTASGMSGMGSGPSEIVFVSAIKMYPASLTAEVLHALQVSKRAKYTD
jgi:hypothetical protein